MIVLVGYSASGKSTIEKELVRIGFKRIISYTTRPPRIKSGEVDGVDYHFISEVDFMDKLNNGFFAENTKYDTVDGVWRYGAAIEDVDNNKVCVLNPDGLSQLKANKDLNIKSFYINVDEDSIHEKLNFRGDKKSEYERRLESDKTDFCGIEDKVDFIINNYKYIKTPNELVSEILNILNKGGDRY